MITKQIPRKHSRGLHSKKTRDDVRREEFIRNIAEARSRNTDIHKEEAVVVAKYTNISEQRLREDDAEMTMFVKQARLHDRGVYLTDKFEREGLEMKTNKEVYKARVDGVASIELALAKEKRLREISSDQVDASELRCERTRREIDVWEKVGVSVFNINT